MRCDCGNDTRVGKCDGLLCSDRKPPAARSCFQLGRPSCLRILPSLPRDLPDEVLETSQGKGMKLPTCVVPHAQALIDYILAYPSHDKTTYGGAKKKSEEGEGKARERIDY